VSFLTAALGRLSRPAPLDYPLARLLDERVLVTGAEGSIGVELVRVLRAAGVDVIASDLSPHENTVDVRWADTTIGAVKRIAPSVILHLAGEKHAPDGEVDPLAVLLVNADGTANVMSAARQCGARVVTVSTCKACDPETAYGASKLLAERVTLAAGGTVARLYNVVETQGNVFDLWAQVPADDPLPVSVCGRFFISLAEAVSLILHAAVLNPGRYTFNPGERRMMTWVATDVHPGRDIVIIPPRRGDRVVEPRHAQCEWIVSGPGGIDSVHSAHDATPVLDSAAWVAA
jgi:FlaA1/EpsC-like NDP-sugar epimerase